MINVLVVDDDKATRVYASALFNQYMDKYGVDISTDVAMSGMKAVTMCRRKKYDVVILDMMLPIISGIEVAETIRTFGKSKKAMIVGHSVMMEDKAIVDKAIKRGVDFFTPKPLTAGGLERMLGAKG